MRQHGFANVDSRRLSRLHLCSGSKESHLAEGVGFEPRLTWAASVSEISCDSRVRRPTSHEARNRPRRLRHLGARPRRGLSSYDSSTTQTFEPSGATPLLTGTPSIRPARRAARRHNSTSSTVDARRGDAPVVGNELLGDPLREPLETCPLEIQDAPAIRLPRKILDALADVVFTNCSNIWPPRGRPRPLPISGKGL